MIAPPSAALDAKEEQAVKTQEMIVMGMSVDTAPPSEVKEPSVEQLVKVQCSMKRWDEEEEEEEAVK